MFSESEIRELQKNKEKFFNLDNFLLTKGFKKIGGVDEAGRGALAGPVVAACVILDYSNVPPGIADSKLLSDKKRRELYPLIIECAVSVGVGMASNQEVDRVNILKATKLAMIRSFKRLTVTPEILLVDALKLNEIPINSISIVKGERRSLAIAAASIIAKVFRDDLMIKYSEEFPEYGFCKNKGYGTASHIRALMDCGPCKIHRYSYTPVIESLKKCKLKNQNPLTHPSMKTYQEDSV